MGVKVKRRTLLCGGTFAGVFVATILTAHNVWSHHHLHDAVSSSSALAAKVEDSGDSPTSRVGTSVGVGWCKAVQAVGWLKAPRFNS